MPDPQVFLARHRALPDRWYRTVQSNTTHRAPTHAQAAAQCVRRLVRSKRSHQLSFSSPAPADALDACGRYAVKRQQLGKMRTSPKGKQQLRYLEREREMLLLLAGESRGTTHRNLFVQLITHDQDADTLQLAMTAVLGGELFNLLEDLGAMAEKDVQFYAACLVTALQHLHARGIAYRDLKSENVLLVIASSRIPTCSACLPCLPCLA